VDGVLYLQVIDPVKASYGIENFLFASTQLSQTTMRSEIGKLELDKTFEEREAINRRDHRPPWTRPADPWGVKITRYEIKNIHPPRTVHRRPGEADARRAREARDHRRVRG
jgi:regulator of protease activity HflC (stomatin/prohibitin superfamily)